MRACAARTGAITSLPSTRSGVSSCWRNAVCSTGLPSDRLIFSPLNRAEIHAGRLRSCAYATRASIACGVTRCFDQSASHWSHDSDSRENRSASAANSSVSVRPASAARCSSSACIGAADCGVLMVASPIPEFDAGRIIDWSAVGNLYNRRFDSRIAAMDTAVDKDLPLKEDTRLLGRLLGDVLRAQTGESGYARIESIRQTAIGLRRASADDAPSIKDELASLLNELPIAQTLDVVRAFSYFSHLANIAEDVHQNRRRRAHAIAGSPPQAGSIAHALDRLRAAGINESALRTVLGQALVSPVLTAHPTEVQRKSILDAEREIARLLQWRDRSTLTPEEDEAMRTGLYRQVLSLWQTAMVRLTTLQVSDEIDNGLAYYRYTFLDEIPRLYTALEDRFAREYGTALAAPPLLRMGSWIGGDRDGNPFVVAETLQYASRAQASLVLLHHLAEVHQLGAELSLSNRLVTPTERLLALAAAAQDPNPHRGDEPYRQALTGIYARLAATARELADCTPPRAPHIVLPSYRAPDEFLA